MSESIKSKMIFSAPDDEALTQAELTAKLQFENQSNFSLEVAKEAEVETQSEIVLNQVLAAKPTFWGYGLKAILVSSAVMIVWQSVDFVVSAYQASDWLALGWSSIVAGASTLGFGALTRELLNLRRLKRRQSERAQAEALLATEGIGTAKEFCIGLAKNGSIASDNYGYNRWLDALNETHNDREVLELYDHMVVRHQDKQARKLVAKYSSEAALMVAFSPLAIADILLVAWRNFRLIEQVSLVYGVELSYWSRLKLLKLVLANMAFAGGSEVVTDIGMDMLSMDLAGRMSMRVSQGIGIGLLTGRLGLKAISLMRPLPWLSGEQPRLSEIRRDLLSQLKPKEEKS